MKFIFKNVKLSFLALFICLGFTACDEEDDFQFDDDVTVTPDPDPTDDGGVESNNILDFAAANGHTSFIAAAEAAGLTDELVADGEITVFMPDNDAFQALLDSNDDWTSLDDIDAGTLELVLWNHVQDGSVMAADLETGYIESMAAAGPDDVNVSLYVNVGDDVMLNGMATVTSADNTVDNGVVHVVDGVIGLPDVTTFATADPTFSSLAAALTEADLVGALQGDGPFTVFAPTDDAFQALLDSNDDWSALTDIPAETLTDVLTYHVISGQNVASGDLTDGQTVTTMQGEDLTINLAADSDNVSVTDVNSNTANVVAANVQATNGIIHAIDMVLLPTLED